jgi:hypothetical protein
MIKAPYEGPFGVLKVFLVRWVPNRVFHYDIALCRKSISGARRIFYCEAKYF